VENNDLEERRFLRVLQRRSTWIILKYISEHEKPLYEDLLQFSTPYSLNRILKELFDWGLIKCFFEIEADDNRVDLTETMRKIFRMLQRIIGTLKRKSRGKGHGGDEQKIMTDYHTLYEQVYENPLVTCKNIAEKTGIPLEKCYQYLKDMYEKSILRGPVLSVKPAPNYCHYAYFLMVKDPLIFCEILEREHIVYLSISSGKWNIMAITDACIDFLLVPQVRECILMGVKSATYCPKVVVIDFEESVKRIQDKITSEGKMRKEKTTLYEEIPINPWDEEEWRLYHTFRKNARCNIAAKLKECSVSPTKYRDWISRLDQFVLIQPAYYPGGLTNYGALDIIFNSHYHQQIADILGLLPSTSLYFSFDEYLFARLFLLNRDEIDEVFTLTDGMESYYSTYSAVQVFPHW
jgi:DNA-binding Lrp family transcriptional regulator